MTSSFRNRWSLWLGLAVALLLVPALVMAAPRHTKTPMTGQTTPPTESVEMFSAIEKGQIDVKLIPKDSTQCRVLIANKTDKPLSVKLPEAFAGVPVLAQRAQRSTGTSTSSAASQGMGGGMGGMGGGGGAMGGGGFFNVAPEKVGQFQVATVCLEHGKGEPRAAVPYEIKPIESFTDKAEVHELCRLLGYGAVSQRAAQVAAWHLNDNMSWEQLAAKQYRFANGTSRPYFSAQEIQAAVQLVSTTAQMAQQRRQQVAEKSQSLNP